MIHDPSFVGYMETIGLDVKDARMFYSMIGARSDDDEVHVEDFIQGCLLMKGNATSLDLNAMRLEFKRNLSSQQKSLKICDDKIDELRNYIIRIFQKMECDSSLHSCAVGG
eukprot:gnl/TRDRNA2_/TRDRNA2_126293_c0_seq1.p1 gnl/TRDRNA2_/TRDRNA2_126293_c0~~gnl/TRDRNA2_/TRDRNA2_126293_c0_seq1.p1  ORF type:complete len:118 (-),score=25.15 gnl/TRDRNA2_/TRDRNA2_126293_c0_seq1:171-503(-)